MSFYFNSETGQCAEVAHGCSSSDNAFATLESCRWECAEHLASSVPDSAARGLQKRHLCFFIKHYLFSSFTVTDQQA